jgi:1,6-anhydro-N-acetylmuramate kinase
MEIGLLEFLLLIGVVLLWISILREWMRHRDASRDTALPPSLEHRLLRVAQAEGGEVTATQVALSLGVGLSEAQAALERLCAQGFAEMEVAEDGVVLYRFPEILHARPTPRLREGQGLEDENRLRRS